MYKKHRFKPSLDFVIDTRAFVKTGWVKVEDVQRLIRMKLSIVGYSRVRGDSCRSMVSERKYQKN